VRVVVPVVTVGTARARFREALEASGLHQTLQVLLWGALAVVAEVSGQAEQPVPLLVAVALALA
jgi:hypothetical protein